MSPMSEREVARRLRAERGPAEPPADLLSRIEGEIPPAITVSPHLSAAGGNARSAARNRRWLLAASLLATVGAGGLGWHLMQELPMGTALARREWGGRAEVPGASRPESRPQAGLYSPVSPASPRSAPSAGGAGSPPVAVQPMAEPDVLNPLHVPVPKPQVAVPERQEGGQARGLPAGQPGGQVAGAAAGQGVPAGEKAEEKIEATSESPLLDERALASGDKERSRINPAAPDAARKSAQAQSAQAPAAQAPSVLAKVAPPPPARPVPPPSPPVAPQAGEPEQALSSPGYVANAPARRDERGATLEITVENAGGGPLSGVIVKVAGAASRQTQPTDAAGRAVFAGLAAGPYEVLAALPGYLPYARSRLDVAGGESLHIRLLPLPSAGIETRRRTAEIESGTGSSVSPAELSAIPTAGEDILDRLRRDLDAGRLPRAGTVPVAELVNAFDYGDPPPAAAADAMRRTSFGAASAPASVWLGAEGAVAPAAGAGRRAFLRFSMRARVLPVDATFRAAFAPRLVSRYREAGSTAWVSARRAARLALRGHPQAATGGGTASWLFEVELAAGGAAPMAGHPGASAQGVPAAPAGTGSPASPPGPAGSAGPAGRSGGGVGTETLATLSLSLARTGTVAARTLLLPGELAPSWQAAPVNLRLAFLAADFAAGLGGAAGRGGRPERATGAAAARDLAAQARALAAAFPGDPRVAELARLTARAAELRAKAAAAH